MFAPDRSFVRWTVALLCHLILTRIAVFPSSVAAAGQSSIHRQRVSRLPRDAMASLCLKLAFRAATLAAATAKHTPHGPETVKQADLGHGIHNLSKAYHVHVRLQYTNL